MRKVFSERDAQGSVGTGGTRGKRRRKGRRRGSSAGCDREIAHTFAWAKRKAERRESNRERLLPVRAQNSGYSDSPKPPPSSFRKRARERSALQRFSFLFVFLFLFLFFFENTLARNRAALSGMDLQSSTPEEYLDGRIFADEAGLGNGPFAIEGDRGLPAQSGVDDRRDLLLLLQGLLLVSGKASSATLIGRPWLHRLSD